MKILSHRTGAVILDLPGCSDLGGANLEGANLRHAQLVGAHLRGANIRGADLRGSDLRCAYLKGADLSGACLWGANLGGAGLEGCNLRSANLGDANLKTADLRFACLQGADLRGADLMGSSIWGCEHENLVLANAASFAGLYRYGSLIMVGQCGTIKIRMGCLCHTVEEWDEIGIERSNPDEFPDDGSPASERRKRAFAFLREEANHLKQESLPC